MEALNNPIAVVAILGIVGFIIKEVVGVTRRPKVDREVAEILREVKDALVSLNTKIDRVETVATNTHEIVHDFAYVRRASEI